MKVLTHKEIQFMAWKLANIIDSNDEYKLTKIYGVPRGGIPVAYILSRYLHPNAAVVDDPEDADVIVDDIIDSGETKKRYEKYGKPFYALYENSSEWLTFPWERSDKDTPLEDNIERIRQFCSDNDCNKAKVMNMLHDLMEELRAT